MLNKVLNMIMADPYHFFYQPASSDFNPSVYKSSQQTKIISNLEIILKGISYKKKELWTFSA